MYEQHKWLEINKVKRYCIKCGLEQTKKNSLEGKILITLYNPKWAPKYSRKCFGKETKEKNG